MTYLLHPTLLAQMRDSFTRISLCADAQRHFNLSCNDYFYLKFEIPIVTPDEYEEKTNLSTALIRADNQLSLRCQARLSAKLSRVELGFRWAGGPSSTEICIYGFAMRLTYLENKYTIRPQVLAELGQELTAAQIFPEGSVVTDFILQHAPQSDVTEKHYFFKSRVPLTYPEVEVISNHVLEKVARFLLTSISPIMPGYVRDGEHGMNSAYQAIQSKQLRLALDEKKIWLFRTDGILAVGVKKAYWAQFGENGLAEAHDESVHQFIDWNNRAGHPSLGCPYPGYDGAALHGGLLAQRNGHLELLNSSGRYYRKEKLSMHERELLEAFVAYRFMRVYGKQEVVFIDVTAGKEYFEMSYFYTNRPLPDSCQRRKYSLETIQIIFDQWFPAMRRAHL